MSDELEHDRRSRMLRRARAPGIARLEVAQHAAIMMISGPVAIASSGWDPAHISGGITLSASNTVASGNVGQEAFGLVSNSSGKWYYEIKNISQMDMAGIANGYTVTGFIANGWTCTRTYATTYGNGTYKSSGVNMSNGVVMGVAVDIGAGKIWFAQNNTWILSGNPAAGTNPTWTTIPTTGGAMRPWGRLQNGGSIELRTSAAANVATLTYAPPSGFTEWG